MIDLLRYFSSTLRNEAGDGGEGGGGNSGAAGASGGAGGDGGAGGASGTSGTSGTSGGGVLLRGGANGAEGSQGSGASGGQGQGGSASFVDLIGEDGSFRDGWQNELAQSTPELEPFRETLGNYKTPVELARALGHAKALVGRKLEHVETVLNPSPDDPTAMGLYRQVLGIPDEGTPKAYEFETPQELQEFVENEQLEDFAKKAHELGLNRKQFAELVRYQADIMLQSGQSLEEAITSQTEQARASFWSEAEKVLGGEEGTNRALDLTVRLLRSGGLEDEQISSVGEKIHLLGPGFIQALAKVAGNTAEDALPAGGSSVSQAISAKDAYRSIIHDASNSKHAIYHNPNHPDHAAVREEVRNLIAKAGKK